MGLRLRLILIVTIPAVLVVGVHGFLRGRHEQVSLREQDLRSADSRAAALHVAVEEAFKDGQIADVGRRLDELFEKVHGVDRIRIFDHDLKVRLVSRPPSISDEVPEEALRRVRDTSRPETFTQQRGGRSTHYHLLPLRNRAGQAQGVIEVVNLSSDTDRLVETAGRDLWIRLALLVIALVAVTALVLQRQVVRPLTQLIAGIQALGQGASGRPLAVNRRDEIGQVAEAFNAMAERLEAARRRLVDEAEKTLELQRHLRQAETLAVVGRLASGLAHEIGTPLNIISGRAEMVLGSLPAGDPRREDLEVVLGQIDRVSTFIRSLLDTVRAQMPEARPVSLGDIVDGVFVLLRDMARRREVALAAAVPPGLPLLLADPRQLQQCLLNLLVNALDATPAGGQVTVSATPADRFGRAGVSLAVTDSGHGIAAAHRSKIFEPFFTTKSRGQGTGLGLAVCRSIVEHHGGHIEVDSHEGVGTTFTTWWPRAEEAAT